MLKTQIRLKMQNSLDKALSELSMAEYQCFERPELDHFKKEIREIKSKIIALAQRVATDPCLQEPTK